MLFYLAVGNAGKWSGLRAFFNELSSPSTTWRRALICDVGANSGTFTRGVMRKLNETKAKSRAREFAMPVNFAIFEPQPGFHESLQKLADSWQGSMFVPAAAYTADTNLTMAVKHDSRAARVVRATDSKPGVVQVAALDFGSWLKRQLVGTQTLVYVRLDIESSEYDLLPRLLLSGALCNVHFLLIEWHMVNAL